jgi:pimeloyl-ACP methyl ester carboxylesterase
MFAREEEAMPYVETPDGVPIFYLDEGPRSDAAVFLIHGEPLDSSFWRRNIPQLSATLRVVSMDIRGRGESGKTEEGHNIAQYARDFRHMLDALGLRTVVAVGWSLGGSVIWDYIQQFGEERLAGYVNVDQRPYRYVSEEDFKRRSNELSTRRLRYHREILRSYLGPEWREEVGVLDWMAYECMKTPTSAHLSLMTDSYYADYRPFLSQVRVPCRLFHARYGLIGPGMAREMGDASPGCRLVLFEHSGHMIPWTEADKFNREVEAFAREMLPPR